MGFELLALLSSKEEFELQKQLDFFPLLKDEEAELKKQEGAKREAVAIANQQFSLSIYPNSAPPTINRWYITHLPTQTNFCNSTFFFFEMS